MYQPSQRARARFAHSQESWEALWDGGVFEKGTVKVESRLRKRVAGLGDSLVGEETAGDIRYLLDWCVTRV